MTMKNILQFHSRKISFSICVLVAAEREFCLHWKGAVITRTS